MKAVLDWLKVHWALLSFLVAVSTAWADQRNEINNLKDAVVQQTDNAKKLDEVRLQSARQDEQLKAIKDSQRTQEQLLRDLLDGQRSIYRKVAR